MQIHEWTSDKLKEVACGEDHHPSLPSRRAALNELLKRERELTVATLEQNAKLRTALEFLADDGYRFSEASDAKELAGRVELARKALQS